jgi:hypothetical protein
VDTPDTAAFVCYGIVALASVVFGLLYLVRSSFMPYHQEAVGKPWQELDPRLRALLLGLLRVVGGGQVACGLSMAILLAFPFRDGESWSRWALPLIGLAATLPTLYATVSIRRKTGAHTPVWISVAGVALIGFGAVLSAV